jgi:trans-aconitate methyltransferase
MSSASPKSTDWSTYYAATAGRPVRDLCRQVLGLAGPGDGRVALDLGCGSGIETAAILAEGWRVRAVDSTPGVGELLRTGVEGADWLTVVRAPMERAELPPAGLVHAAYSLPFLAPADFAELWQRIRGCLRTDGWLAVTLFGDRDSWASGAGMTFLAEPQARELFAGLEVVSFVEDERDGTALSGPKHWHTYDVIARRA